MRMFYAEISRFYNEYEGIGIFSTEKKAYAYVHKHYPDIKDDDIYITEWAVDEGIIV